MRSRLSVVLLCLTLVSCSRNPNGPDVSAASFAGTWGGYHRLESWDPPHSSYQAGTQRPVLIDISSDGRSATITSELPSPHSAAFSGVMDDDGSLILTPVSAPASLTAVTRVVLRRLAPGRLAGQLTYISDFPSRTFTTTIDQMTRVVSPPPATSVESLAGSWEGNESGAARYVLCAGPPALCAGQFPFPRAASYVLRVVKVASGYEADLVVSHANGTHRFRTAGRASGDGIVFDGLTMPADPDGFAQILSSFEIHPSAGSGVTGSLEYTTIGPLGSATRQIEILRGTRGDTVRLPGSFQGDWNGRYFVRSCTGDCAGRALSGFVSFSLSQRGTGIVGRSSLINTLTGTASGNSATIGGEVTAACGQGGASTCLTRVSGFTATLDALGAMQGSLILERRESDGSLYTLGIDLVDVVRLPSLVR